MRLPVQLPCRVFRSEAQASRTLPSPCQVPSRPLLPPPPLLECPLQFQPFHAPILIDRRCIKPLQAYPSLLSLSPDLHRFARSELVQNVSGLFEEVLTLNHPSKVIGEFWKLLLLVSVRCEKSLWP